MDIVSTVRTIAARHSRNLAAALILLLGAPAWAQVGQLSWFEDGRPSAQALVAVDALRSAAVYGLEPRDYDADRLGTAVQSLAQAPSADLAHAQLDAALTGAMHHYLADLQAGRVDPRQLHARFVAPRRRAANIAAFLRAAIDERRLGQAIGELASVQPMSRPLIDALAFYRTLDGDARWNKPLPLPRGGKLVAGQEYAELGELTRRLRAVGDLVEQAPDPIRFEGPLVAALERFQRRHGLERDAVLGRNTLAQLNVTPGQRARQIALTLERLRWTPFLQAPRMIAVNLPEFMLRAYEVDAQRRIDVRLTMKIIVGKALDTRTPLFDEAMRYIEFSPYWNVPRSIATKELVPQLREDPAHFSEQGFEFVTDQRTVVTALADAHLEAVMQGQWRIRQRPGPKNALGDIKFIFPNATNIYLHHTPATRLFARERRDLSHGCIRVEEPVALARFVLHGEPDWTEERIREAMELGTSRTIRLRDPLPVLIHYNTVVVKEGMVHFFRDLYDHDAALDVALRQHSESLLRDRPNAMAGG